MVDRGFTARYDYALQMLKEVPYNKWREYDPADTIRFYSL
jgi:NitT/TauT family transport system substrate-binding protein